MTLSIQLQTLLSMVATGMGMAWVFDLYTWCREKLHLRKILTFLFDIGYWIAFALTVLAVLYNVNEGKLRITLFFAILIGGFFYFQFLSRPFLKIWDGFVDLIIRIVKFIFRLVKILIYTPIFWLVSTLIGVMLWLATGLWKVVVTISRWMSRPFIAFFNRIHHLAIALVQKIGKMIVQLFKKKPRDE